MSVNVGDRRKTAAVSIRVVSAYKEGGKDIKVNTADLKQKLSYFFKHDRWLLPTFMYYIIRIHIHAARKNFVETANENWAIFFHECSWRKGCVCRGSLGTV